MYKFLNILGNEANTKKMNNLTLLDLVDYFNAEAKKLGFLNFKQLIKSFKDNYGLETPMLLRCCDLRNDIAHGKSCALDLSAKDLSRFYMYAIAVVLVSRGCRLDKTGDDVKCYNIHGRYILSFNRLMSYFVYDNKLLLLNIEDLIKWGLY